MRPIQDWLDAYGASHQNPTNKRIHWVCVPAIYCAIIGLLWCIPNDALVAYGGSETWVTWGTVGMLIPLVWYAVLSRPIFIGMVVFSAIMAAICVAIDASSPVAPWIVHTTVFVVAWVFQFVGHKIEGVKPSFFEDVQYLLVGPAWLMSFIYQRVGLRY